jgi:hypothetical protein
MSTLAYRVQLRRPPRRRRRYRKYSLSRWATFGTGFFAPLGGWAYLGEPLHWAGLAGLVLAGEIVIPLTLLFLLFCVPALLMGGLVPRKWRISHRRRHGREQCKSAVITTGLRRVTFAMDRGRCLYCGITARELAALPPRKGKDGRLVARRLHADHYRPWIAGFLTVLVNMGLLCDEHNEVKSCYYRERSGYIWYHGGSRTPEREALAAEIVRTIRWRRWNPLRLLRAVWALG